MAIFDGAASNKDIRDTRDSSILQLLSLYSSVAERQSCKLKVLGSIPSGGFFAAATGALGKRNNFSDPLINRCVNE